MKVTHGVITLYGSVEKQYQSEEAADAVRPLKGVRCIANEIEVKPGVSISIVRSDIEDALKRNAAIDASHISVETTGATVTLRGTVRSWSERDAAERAAWGAPGVTDVNNYITIV